MIKINCIESNMDKFIDMASSHFAVKASRWVKIFVVMALIGIAGLCAYNYIVDPFNYFSREYSEYKPWDGSQYYKVNYISDNPDKYDCFVIGGSNSGVLNPEQIDKYTGYNTYSMSFAAGNWYSYYIYTKFLIEHTKAKCIILHLSSTELEYSQEDIADSEVWNVPSALEGDWFGKLKETKKFLLMYLSAKRAQKEYVFVKDNGMADWTKMQEQYNKDPDKYVEKYVLENYENKISEWSSLTLDKGGIENALSYAKQIKNLCNDNNVKLMVICGPVFTSKRTEFECEDYYDYLKRLTDIVDIYDFSDITEINANPYNFYNSTHYNDQLGEMVIDVVFGRKQIQEFGLKLTKSNIDGYVDERKEKYEKYMHEYDDTETITYKN